MFQRIGVLSLLDGVPRCKLYVTMVLQRIARPCVLVGWRVVLRVLTSFLQR